MIAEMMSTEPPAPLDAAALETLIADCWCTIFRDDGTSPLLQRGPAWLLRMICWADERDAELIAELRAEIAAAREGR